MRNIQHGELEPRLAECDLSDLFIASLNPSNFETLRQSQLSISIVIPASSHPPASISEFFNSYWEAISRRNWTAVILHSWRNLPEKIESDVDYAVRGTQPRELLEFLAKYSRSKGWRLIQVIEHEPDAYFCVCVQ